MLGYFWFLPPPVTTPCSHWFSPLQVDGHSHNQLSAFWGFPQIGNHEKHQVKEQALADSTGNLFCRAAHQSSPDADVRDLLLRSSEETSQVKLYHHVKFSSLLVDYCGAQYKI